jgi:hypothetical protein
VISCTLERRFTLRAPDSDVLAAVRYLACEPDLPGRALQDVAIAIEPAGGGYRIFENDVLIGEVESAKSVVEFLHIHLFQQALDDRPDAALIHAACLRRGDKRLLIAGTKGAGKTTLALRMTMAGYRIEGDEQVYIDRAGVIARPRGCRVKATSLPYLPEMAEVIAASPSYSLEGYGTIFNVDPRTIGSSWRIEHGPVDLVVLLEPNHGGTSSIESIPAMAAMQLLMPEVGMRGIGRAASIAAIAALAGQVPAYRLLIGEHAGALRCIEQALGP